MTHYKPGRFYQTRSGLKAVCLQNKMPNNDEFMWFAVGDPSTVDVWHTYLYFKTGKISQAQFGPGGLHAYAFLPGYDLTKFDLLPYDFSSEPPQYFCGVDPAMASNDHGLCGIYEIRPVPFNAVRVPPVIDWEQIKPIWRWAYKKVTGEWMLSTHKPTAGEYDFLMTPMERLMPRKLWPLNYTGAWQHSPVENPYGRK